MRATWADTVGEVFPIQQYGAIEWWVGPTDLNQFDQPLPLNWHLTHLGPPRPINQRFP